LPQSAAAERLAGAKAFVLDGRVRVLGDQPQPRVAAGREKQLGVDPFVQRLKLQGTSRIAKPAENRTAEFVLVANRVDGYALLEVGDHSQETQFVVRAGRC